MCSIQIRPPVRDCACCRLQLLYVDATNGRYWDVVSMEAKDFIRKLLNKNPGSRLTAKQAILHPWLVKGDHELIAVHLEKTMRQLKDFNGKRKFKAAAKMIITTRRLSNAHHDAHHVARGHTSEACSNCPPHAPNQTGKVN